MAGSKQTGNGLKHGRRISGAWYRLNSTMTELCQPRFLRVSNFLKGPARTSFCRIGSAEFVIARWIDGTNTTVNYRGIRYGALSEVAIGGGTRLLRCAGS